MPKDESAAIGSYVRDPKYRADSMEWFQDPTLKKTIQFRGPEEVYTAIEQAAEQADRSFNSQFRYVIDVCRGTRTVEIEDTRTLKEWRELFGQMEMQCFDDGQWIPCTVTFQGKEDTSC